jgi:antitoxin HicB
MYYHFQVFKEKKDYWASCLELKGCVTQGDNLDELKKNMAEALDLYLDELETLDLPLPLSDKQFPKNDVPSGKDIYKVPVEVKKAFALNIKKLRLEKGLTQNELAKKLGMSNIYSYQRLESPKKANPSLLTLNKIKKILPELNIDMIFT